MSLPAPEDVTSQSLVDTISKNPWTKARGALIREYAINETARKAADEIEALISSDLIEDTNGTLTAWIKATREATVMEVTAP